MRITLELTSCGVMADNGIEGWMCEGTFLEGRPVQACVFAVVADPENVRDQEELAKRLPAITHFHGIASVVGGEVLMSSFGVPMTRDGLRRSYPGIFKDEGGGLSAK